MSVEFMNNAAIELSAEELDVVTGGYLPSIPSVALNLDTFHSNTTVASLSGVAGPGGAASTATLQKQQIDSAALTVLPV